MIQWEAGGKEHGWVSLSGIAFPVRAGIGPKGVEMAPEILYGETGTVKSGMGPRGPSKGEEKMGEEEEESEPRRPQSADEARHSETCLRVGEADISSG